MTILSNTQNTQNAAPAQGSSSTDGGNAFSKIAAGPAALAQLLIYQIMALYAEIIQLDQKQKVSMVQAQSKEAQANAQATVSSGLAQMYASITSGIMSLTSAAGGFLIQEGLSRTDDAKELNANEKTAQADNTRMKNLDEMVANTPARQGAGQQDADLPSQAVRDRMAELKAGNYKNAKADATTEEAIGRMKQKQNEFDDWKKEFKEEKFNVSKDYNSAVQAKNNLMSGINNRKTLLEQLTQSGSSTAQAIGSAKKAEQDANAALFSTSSQMAGSAAADFGQALNKAFESQNAEIQILENINRTNSVSG